MKPSMSDHPEIQPGEVFLMNASREFFREISWKTKRCGNIPYNVHGTAMFSSGFFPVFVQIAELPEEIVQSIRRRQEEIDREFGQ